MKKNSILSLYLVFPFVAWHYNRVLFIANKIQKAAASQDDIPNGIMLAAQYT